MRPTHALLLRCSRSTASSLALFRTFAFRIPTTSFFYNVVVSPNAPTAARHARRQADEPTSADCARAAVEETTVRFSDATAAATSDGMSAVRVACCAASSAAVEGGGGGALVLLPTDVHTLFPALLAAAEQGELAQYGVEVGAVTWPLGQLRNGVP